MGTDRYYSISWLRKMPGQGSNIAELLLLSYSSILVMLDCRDATIN